MSQICDNGPLKVNLWHTVCCKDVQWNVSNTDTLGPITCVLIREVSSFQGANNTYFIWSCRKSLKGLSSILKDWPSSSATGYAWEDGGRGKAGIDGLEWAHVQFPATWYPTVRSEAANPWLEEVRTYSRWLPANGLTAHTIEQAMMRHARQVITSLLGPQRMKTWMSTAWWHGEGVPWDIPCKSGFATCIQQGFINFTSCIIPQQGCIELPKAARGHATT